MQQPTFDIRPYSDRAFVIRTDPPRFLQDYGGHLAPLYCKWQANLKIDPNDLSQGTLGGWICSKKNEQSVMNVLNQIRSGALPPLSTKDYHAQNQSSQPQFSQPQLRPSSSMLTSFFGQAQAPPKAPLTLAPATLAPIYGLPGGISEQYQPILVQVLRPIEGQTIQLSLSGQKIPMVVQSTELENGIVTKAIVRLPDGNMTRLQLDLTAARWHIPGFAQEHSISLN